MSDLRVGYFSANAASWGYSLYKNQEGDIVTVTEAVRPGQRPISNYDDLEYVGILETFIERKYTNPLILLTITTPMFHDDITALERILYVGTGKTPAGFCGKIKFEKEEKKLSINSSEQLRKILDPSPFKKYVRKCNLKNKNPSKRPKQIQNLPKKFKKRYR